MIGLELILKRGKFGRPGKVGGSAARGGGATAKKKPVKKPKVAGKPVLPVKPGQKPVTKPGQKPPVSTSAGLSKQQIHQYLTKSGLLDTNTNPEEAVMSMGFNAGESAKAFAVANNVHGDLVKRFPAVAEAAKLKQLVLINGKDLTFEVKDKEGEKIRQLQNDFEDALGIYYRGGKQIMGVASLNNGWVDPPTPFMGDSDDGFQTATECFRHELAHNFQETSATGKKMYLDFKKAYLKLSDDVQMQKISVYGASVDMRGKPMIEEGFAECFRIYTHPNYKKSKKKLPKSIEKLFDKHLAGVETKEMAVYYFKKGEYYE